MKQNAAKEYLSQIAKYNAMIDSKLSEIDRLYAMVTRITPTMKQDVVSGGGESDKLANAVAKIVDLKNEVNREVDYLVDLKREVARKLEGLKKPNHYKVLHLKYISLMTWDAIAAEMDYCKRNVQILHGNALQEFAKILREGEQHAQDVQSDNRRSFQ